jgi:uncharacterized protein
LTPERYAVFLKNLFGFWYEEFIKGDKISIRYFDNLIEIFMGYRPEACGMLGECQCQFVIEANGGVYPCDFYVTDDWVLVSIKDSELDTLAQSDKSTAFIDISRNMNNECIGCKWKNICHGGCRRDRGTFGNEGQGLNYYCPAYKEFFDLAAVKLKKLAALMNR